MSVEFGVWSVWFYESSLLSIELTEPKRKTVFNAFFTDAGITRFFKIHLSDPSVGFADSSPVRGATIASPNRGGAPKGRRGSARKPDCKE